MYSVVLFHQTRLLPARHNIALVDHSECRKAWRYSRVHMRRDLSRRVGAFPVSLNHRTRIGNAIRWHVARIGIANLSDLAKTGCEKSQRRLNGGP